MSKGKSDLVDLDAGVKWQTNKAWLLDFGGDKPVWVPKSQCEVEINDDGKTAKVTMQIWLAKEKGLI